MSSRQHNVKAAVQGLLRRAGLYHRIKSSRAYLLYWNMADPGLLCGYQAELEFYRRTLRGLKLGDVIFDVGANEGHKTSVFLELGARVVAVEPDPASQAVLHESFLTYRLRKKPLTIEAKAVSDRAGRATMWVDEPGSAKNTLNDKWVETLKADSERFGRTLSFKENVQVETTTLDELIQKYGRPFYIKIDVEGHEPSVLRGLSTAVPFVSFEVNLPEFRKDAVECIERLAEIAPQSTFNYTVECSEGMALSEWLARGAFLDAFACCEQPSLEIFAKA